MGGNQQKRIRVVIGINDFIVGGAQKLIADLCRKFDHSQFEFHLVTLMRFPEKKDFYDLIPGEVEVHKLHFRGFSDARSWLELHALLRKIKPDIVWSHLFFSNTVFRTLGLFLSYKCIATEHNTYIWKNVISRATDWALSYRTDRIVAVSRTVRDFTAQQENIPLRKFVVIHNGIDLAAIDSRTDCLVKETLRLTHGIRQESLVLVNVGRLSDQKNHRLMIDAFNMFHRQRPDSILFIVGGGGLQTQLANQVAALSLQECIVFTGSQKDVFPFLVMADFFISTSKIEGFGIAHIEAMACGIPVISTKTAGPDEFITGGVNGHFIESTVDSVLSGMTRMSKSDLSQMGVEARQVAEQFDIGRTAQEYETLLEKVARN